MSNAKTHELIIMGNSNANHSQSECLWEMIEPSETTDIKQQGVSSESLDGGITKSMNQPGIKVDIHCKNSKLEGGNNQKYNQPGLKEDHKLEGGNNQKYDQPGVKEDHNNKDGNNQKK
nr:hypothetical protein [Tanacetum cinerariifolium]